MLQKELTIPIFFQEDSANYQERQQGGKGGPFFPIKRKRCPGFGQDRVNFHQNPGRGTAGWADPTPTWPNRAGYSIPCAVVLGSGGGSGAAGTHSWDRRAQERSCPRERLSGSCGLFCVFPLSVSLLFLFSLCLLFC